MIRDYIRTGPRGELIICRGDIARVDISDIEQLRLRVTTLDGCEHVAEGIHAVEGALLMVPGAVENRRLRWHRHAWAVHNLVGHPVMQLLSFLGLYGAAFWVHDVTVPKPRA